MTLLLSPQLVCYSAIYEVNQCLALDEPAWAAHAVVRTRERLGNTGDVAVIDALVLAHGGRRDRAARRLEPVLSGEVAVIADLVHRSLDARGVPRYPSPPSPRARTPHCFVRWRWPARCTRSACSGSPPRPWWTC